MLKQMLQKKISFQKWNKSKCCIFIKRLQLYLISARMFFFKCWKYNNNTLDSIIQPYMSYRASHWTNGGAVKKIYIVKVRIYVSINWRNNFLLLKKNLKSYDDMHLTCTSTKYIYVYIHYCLQFRTHKFFFLSSI